MVKIEIIIGSPRKNGNTAILCNKLKVELESLRLQVNISFLYDYTIKPCTDCRGCKRGTMDCIVKDEAAALYENIEKADIIIFGTPIYWYAPTATMKLFIDRLRPYYLNKKLKGKKGALILSAGSGASDCDLTIEMYRRIFKTLGIEFSGAITAEAYNAGDVCSNEKVNNEIELLIKRIKSFRQGLLKSRK